MLILHSFFKFESFIPHATRWKIVDNFQNVCFYSFGTTRVNNDSISISEWTISDYPEQTTNYVSQLVAALFRSQTCVPQSFIVSLDVILSARSQEDHMEAEIHTHTQRENPTERCSPGHSEILHPESPFIKNTLPKTALHNSGLCLQSVRGGSEWSLK